MPPGGGTRHQLVKPSAEAIDQVGGHAVKVQISPYCGLSVCAIIRDKPAGGGLERVAIEDHGAIGVDMRQLFFLVQRVVCAFSSIAGQDSVGAPVIKFGGR